MILINVLRVDFDYILIDLLVGIESGFEYVILYVDMVLVVVMLEVSFLRDSDRVIGIIDVKFNWVKKGMEVYKYLIINCLKFELVVNGEMIFIEEVFKILCLFLIGIILEDYYIILVINKGELVICVDCESVKVY